MSALIQISELQETWQALVAIDSGATNCKVEYLNQFVSLSDCEPGQVSLSIKAETLADEYGNLGPAQPQLMIYEFVAEPEPEPSLSEPSPSPSSTPSPEQALPQLPESNVDQSDPVSSVPEVVVVEPIAEAPVLDSNPAPSRGNIPQELTTPEAVAESLQPVQEPATTQAETKEVIEQASELSEIEQPGTSVEQPGVDPIQLEPEVTDGVSLVQFGSGSEGESERPGWLVFVLVIAFAAALVAGVIGYRLIGK
jgi:hypothetical protein